MVERRGCNLDLSFGAFNGDELVGLTLNGIGTWNGKNTAYDTGTGIVKEFRKQGIASRMFKESLPVLRQHFITQYLLEVIKTNTSAVDLYRKAGFEVTRELDYYVQTKDKVSENVTLKDDEMLKIEEIKIDYVDWDEFKSFWDINPSWQNSMDSILRKSDYFKILVMLKRNEIIGYGIIEKHTGDIPQIAISHNNRRKGYGTKLFHSLLKHTTSDQIKVINADADYMPFKKFANKMDLPLGIGQYEMILRL
jgi:ribosomal protein S18 acetylase RimI-like enzyme